MDGMFGEMKSLAMSFFKMATNYLLHAIKVLQNHVKHYKIWI